MKGWDVWLGGINWTTVFYDSDMSGEEVRQSLIYHDGFCPDIAVKESV